MSFVKNFFLIVIFLSISCNGMRPLCQFPQNEGQFFGLGLFMSGVSCIAASFTELMKISFLCGGRSSADRMSIKKQILKQSCMMFALGTSATITGFLMLDCGFNNKTSKI